MVHPDLQIVCTHWPLGLRDRARDRPGARERARGSARARGRALVPQNMDLGFLGHLGLGQPLALREIPGPGQKRKNTISRC